MTLALPRIAAAQTASHPATPTLRRLWAALVQAPARARQRRALARLDDRLLADVGLTRAQALAEAERPAWDAPQHWRN